MDYKEYASELRKAASYYQDTHPDLPDVIATYRKSATAIETLLAEREVDRWISVQDKLPELFAPVIVFRKARGGKGIVESGCMDMGGWWRVYGTRTKSVTHWMPLPEPPEEAAP